MYRVDFGRIFSLLMLTLLLQDCATPTPNSIREVNETDITNCELVGTVAGSDSIFVGLTGSVGRRNAKARAMNQAVAMGATDVVWSQMGTSLTSEWVGRVYRCTRE